MSNRPGRIAFAEDHDLFLHSVFSCTTRRAVLGVLLHAVPLQHHQVQRGVVQPLGTSFRSSIKRPLQHVPTHLLTSLRLF